ncbi:MAG: sel1 repeat family protein [Robiginitomaculum sp.]|nr:sel1 repeat family protein [Robiginitomaculum sp.]
MILTIFVFTLTACSNNELQSDIPPQTAEKPTRDTSNSAPKTSNDANKFSQKKQQEYLDANELNAQLLKATKALEDEEFDLAHSIYNQEAKLGNTEAMFMLFALYRSGVGVEKSSQTSLSWLQKCADLGYAKCQGLVGFFYMRHR